jgi:hypothetical protein
MATGDHTLRIRLSARERAGLERAARKVPVSTWARSVLLDAAGVKPDDTPEREAAQRVAAGETAGAELVSKRWDKPARRARKKVPTR